jgi:hypothetical protein
LGRAGFIHVGVTVILRGKEQSASAVEAVARNLHPPREHRVLRVNTRWDQIHSLPRPRSRRSTCSTRLTRIRPSRLAGRRRSAWSRRSRGVSRLRNGTTSPASARVRRTTRSLTSSRIYDEVARKPRPRSSRGTCSNSRARRFRTRVSTHVRRRLRQPEICDEVAFRAAPLGSNSDGSPDGR